MAQKFSQKTLRNINQSKTQRFIKEGLWKANVLQICKSKKGRTRQGEPYLQIAQSNSIITE